MLVWVFNRKARKGLRKVRKVFLLAKALSRKVIFLQQTLPIVSLSEVEDHTRSSVKKIANLCRVTYVVFDFAQTDKTRRIKKSQTPIVKLEFGIFILNF